jgi:hypothetical protein
MAGFPDLYGFGVQASQHNREARFTKAQAGYLSGLIDLFEVRSYYPAALTHAALCHHRVVGIGGA